ncbi:hypothetical protein HNR33_001355 [Brassicibacter mesophilus]
MGYEMFEVSKEKVTDESFKKHDLNDHETGIKLEKVE